MRMQLSGIPSRQADEGKMDGWMDGWMDDQADGQVGEQTAGTYTPT